MSKNFLNFLTTSVIILSCGTTVNSSSCYCMEDNPSSDANTLLTQMNKQLQDEIKEAGLNVDKTGHIIIDNIDDNKLFNQTNWLRRTQIVYNDTLIEKLKIIGIPERIIQPLNSSMTSCLHAGQRIGESLEQLWNHYNEIVLEDINILIYTTNSYLSKLSEFQDYADNKDDINFIEGSSLLLTSINILLKKFHANKSMQQLGIVISEGISELRQLLEDPSHHIN